jgi:hypothetical protein
MSMNVSVRFLSVAALASLTMLASSALPLAAQSAAQAGLLDTSVALAPVAVAPTSTVNDSASNAASATTMRGPTMASARVASHAITSTRGEAPAVIQNRTSNRNSVALMIVGGAALVVGAVIGDDAGTLVMLGGAAVGLWGLYLFLT